MSSRQLKVEKNADGTLTLKGAAYIADKPNINGITYPRHVLEKALDEYNAAPDKRWLTGKVMIRPKLGDAIGRVTSAELDGDAVYIEAQTLPGRDLEFIERAGHSGLLALAGAGIASIEKNEVQSLEITNIGLASLKDVQVPENS